MLRYPRYTTKKWLDAYRHLRLGGKVQLTRYLDEFEHNHVHILSTKPPIIYMWWGRDDLALHQELSSYNLTIFYLFPWCFNCSEIPSILAHLRRINKSYPAHRIVFLCNEHYSVEELRKAGVAAEFIHQNAFVNENVFKLRTGITPTHDALYSASLAPYKRHFLAEKIESLIIMSYAYSGSTSSDYEADARRRLAHAWWAKDSLSDDQKVSVQSLVDLYARAHVGLCLSAIEGGMFVSMEYLLCGLPVVSTKSVGGRDAFWDSRYVIVCEDSPELVSESVKKLKEQAISRLDVRRWTLEKVGEHRERLRILMDRLGARLECPWAPGSHGITSFTNLRQLGKRLKN